MTVRRALARLLALAQKGSLERDLEAEVQAHLEMAEHDALAAGLSPEEARRAARRQFGGIEQVKEQHRESRSPIRLENLLRDFRYGLNGLARDPSLSAIVVGVLALGIGANVAMFSLVDAVLLKPLPFPDPERIVRVWEAPRPGVTNSTTTPDFLDWRRLGTSFEALSAEVPVSVTLTGQGEPTRLGGKAVTADYFRVFATTPLLGRTFTQNEDRPGADATVVLSHATWQAYFGAAPDILARRIILDGQAHQIIGVLPPGPFDRDDAAFWKSLIFTPDQYLRESHWLGVHGRIRKGVSLEQAREQMISIRSSMIEVNPFWKKDWTIVVEPLGRLLVGDNLQRSIFVAFGAVFLVLLITCANVANLLLARGAARSKEMAVRAALGASRGRLVAQLLTESLVLCLLGGAAGLAVGSLLIQAATPYLAQSIPYTASIGLDHRVFAFAAAVALGVAVVVSALPALQTSAGSLGRSLNLASRGSSGSHHRLRRFIVTVEVALSVVLVCGALLLFRSLSKLQQLDTGIKIENVITMSLSLPARDYPTADRAAAFYQGLAERVKAIPGVLESGLSTHLPLRWISNGEAVEIAGIQQPVNVRFKRVDPGYFRALGIPLLAGRDITERDRLGARRVMVINQALASRLAEVGGMKNPVGQSVGLYSPRYIAKGTVTEDVEIAGVIRSERVAGPGSPDPAVVYVPLAQVPTQEIKLIVRTQADPSSLVPGLRDAVRELDRNLPLGDVATMQEVRERTLSGARRPAWLIGAFALIAALLTAIGLYGVLSQAVTQQRREIGIRLALGAQPRDVVSQVLRNALTLVLAGLALGTLGAIALTRVMKSLLFEVSPLDPVAFTVALGCMTAVGLLAGFVPASRAAHVDPVTTLRDEG
ncbi:MAG: ABC transporter permease [Bryobacterales bacterium]|nr:ABC transporter permease [Bryobacterales bacterium]